MLKNLSILHLALSGVKGLLDKMTYSGQTFISSVHGVPIIIIRMVNTAVHHGF